MTGPALLLPTAAAAGLALAVLYGALRAARPRRPHRARRGRHRATRRAATGWQLREIRPRTRCWSKPPPAPQPTGRIIPDPRAAPAREQQPGTRAPTAP